MGAQFWQRRAAQCRQIDCHDPDTECLRGCMNALRPHLNRMDHCLGKSQGASLKAWTHA